MKKYLIIFFIVLITLNALLFNYYLFDTSHYLKLPKDVRNYSELIAVIITALLGCVYYMIIKSKSELRLWVITYGAVITFLVITTLIDNYFVNISKDGQYRFYTVKSIFMGPMIFFTFLLFKQITSTKNNS